MNKNEELRGKNLTPNFGDEPIEKVLQELTNSIYGIHV